MMKRSHGKKRRRRISKTKTKGEMGKREEGVDGFSLT